jgi:hypothetical protein
MSAALCAVGLLLQCPNVSQTVFRGTLVLREVVSNVPRENTLQLRILQLLCYHESAVKFIHAFITVSLVSHTFLA